MKIAVALIEGHISIHEALIFQSETKQGKHTAKSGLFLRDWPGRLVLYPLEAATCAVIFFGGDWADAGGRAIDRADLLSAYDRVRQPLQEHRPAWQFPRFPSGKNIGLIYDFENVRGSRRQGIARILSDITNQQSLISIFEEKFDDLS